MTRRHHADRASRRSSAGWGAVGLQLPGGAAACWPDPAPATDACWPDPPPATDACWPGPTTRGNGEKVLVVDDEPAVREVVSRILRRNGYAALEASGGEQALALASSQEIQLLLTDSVMPGMSGAGLAKLVVGLKPGLPVLYMSGFSAGVLSPERVSSGELAFIQKPFTAEALLTKVRATLEISTVA